MNMINVNLLLNNEQKQERYHSLVVAKIRERYSQDEENAILRKKLANLDDNGQFETYNAFVEQVKSEIKLTLGL